MALLSGEVETARGQQQALRSGQCCGGGAGFRMALLSGEVETYRPERPQQGMRFLFRMALLSGEVET